MHHLEFLQEFALQKNLVEMCAGNCKLSLYPQTLTGGGIVRKPLTSQSYCTLAEPIGIREKMFITVN